MKKPINKSLEKKKPAKNKVWLIVLAAVFGFLLVFILFFGRVTGLAHFAPRIFKWCGDGICEGKENCASCAKDCILMTGDICCNSLILHGDCCDDSGCPSPKVCLSNTCQMLDSCNDSDRGMNVTKFGTVSGYQVNVQYSKADSCDGNYLKEYYCVGNYSNNTIIPCTGEYVECNNGACLLPYCGDGQCRANENCSSCSMDCLKKEQVCCKGITYTGECCSNIHCTSLKICVNHQCKIPNLCNDSDDGITATVKGSVSGYKDGKEFTIADSCEDEDVLKEYYCYNNLSAFKGVWCTGNYSGCSNGICHVASCGDGTCNTVENCTSCASDCLLSGYVCCDGSSYQGSCCSDSQCTSPAACQSHVCRIPDSCSDSDGGEAITVLGTVSGYYNNVTFSYTDSCATNETVKEYYCSGTTSGSIDVSCIVNATIQCIGGVCLV
jgi:hypothetical protein